VEEKIDIVPSFTSGNTSSCGNPAKCVLVADEIPRESMALESRESALVQG
jgi:hypothetical protein